MDTACRLCGKVHGIKCSYVSMRERDIRAIKKKMRKK